MIFMTLSICQKKNSIIPFQLNVYMTLSFSLSLSLHLFLIYYTFSNVLFHLPFLTLVPKHSFFLLLYISKVTLFSTRKFIQNKCLVQLSDPTRFFPNAYFKLEKERNAYMLELSVFYYTFRNNPIPYMQSLDGLMHEIRALIVQLMWTWEKQERG